MNLRSRIAALVKRHQAGMVERIGRMGSDERVALVRRMFADRAEQAGPEHEPVLWADLLGALAAFERFAPVVHAFRRTLAPFHKSLPEVLRRK